MLTKYEYFRSIFWAHHNLRYRNKISKKQKKMLQMHVAFLLSSKGWIRHNKDIGKVLHRPKCGLLYLEFYGRGWMYL